MAAWKLNGPICALLIKENIKAPRHWPLCGEFTGTGEFPHKGPVTRKMVLFDGVIVFWKHNYILALYITALRLKIIIDMMVLKVRPIRYTGRCIIHSDALSCYTRQWYCGTSKQFGKVWDSTPCCPPQAALHHYNDVMISAMAPEITSFPIVYLTAYSGSDQRKHQSSVSLGFVWGINRWPVNSPHKGLVTRKIFPFDDVIMITSFVSDEYIYIC